MAKRRIDKQARKVVWAYGHLDLALAPRQALLILRRYGKRVVTGGFQGRSGRISMRHDRGEE
jgi:hypothetical protein